MIPTFILKEFGWMALVKLYLIAPPLHRKE